MEEDCRKINLEDKYKGALRKAKEVREDIHKRNNGCEPSIAECLAYDMQYVEQYVEHLIARNKELEQNYINPSKARFTYYDTGKKTKMVIEGFISKSKIKEKFQNKRNQIFGCTYVDEKQWQPFDKALDIINDLEKELLEEED